METSKNVLGYINNIYNRVTNINNRVDNIELLVSNYINNKNKSINETDSTTLFISSANADTVSSLGSTIGINLKTPINTTNKRVRLLSSNVWYSFPNIYTELNNKTIKFTYNAVVYTITLRDGIYSLKDINETIAEEFITLGLPDTLFTLIPDDATALITMFITTALNFTMDMDDPSNILFKTYLGFTAIINTNINLYYESTNKAALNINNVVYVHCSFATGTYFNQLAGSNIIGAINLSHKPNSLITTENNIPVSSKCFNNDFLGYFRIWLTNENGTLLNMGGESFSLVLQVY